MSKILNTKLNEDVVILKIATGVKTPSFLSLMTRYVRMNWGILFMYKFRWIVSKCRVGRVRAALVEEHRILQ